jgi:DNA-binding NarL/FixJ family response regulator
MSSLTNPAARGTMPRAHTAENPLALVDPTRVRIDVPDDDLRRRALTGLRAAGMAEGGDDAPLLVASVHRSASHRIPRIRRLREEMPGAALVVIVADRRTELHQTLAAGVRGVIAECDVDAALGATLHAVLCGQIVVPPQERPALQRPVMSHREKEVLELVVLGLTNQQIAARLFLSESTVKSHLNSVYSKLGARSRSEATALTLDPTLDLGLRLPGLLAATPAAPAMAHAGR